MCPSLSAISLQLAKHAPHIIQRFCAMAFIDCVPHARLPDQTLHAQDCTTDIYNFQVNENRFHNQAASAPDQAVTESEAAGPANGPPP